MDKIERERKTESVCLCIQFLRAVGAAAAAVDIAFTKAAAAVVSVVGFVD